MPFLDTFLDYAACGDTPRALILLSRLTREELAHAKRLCCVPACKPTCRPEFQPCECEPDTPAQYRIQYHAPKQGITLRGQHFGRHKPIPGYLVALATADERKSLVKGKEVLHRPSCGCPVRFKPCPVHVVAIEVPAQIEAAILARVAPRLYADLPPAPFPLDFDAETDRERIILAMQSRLNCSTKTGLPSTEGGRMPTMPRHPDDAWIDPARLERNRQAFNEGFSRGA